MKFILYLFYIICIFYYIQVLRTKCFEFFNDTSSIRYVDHIWHQGKSKQLIQFLCILLSTMTDCATWFVNPERYCCFWRKTSCVFHSKRLSIISLSPALYVCTSKDAGKVILINKTKFNDDVNVSVWNSTSIGSLPITQFSKSSATFVYYWL